MPMKLPSVSYKKSILVLIIVINIILIYHLINNYLPQIFVPYIKQETKKIDEPLVYVMPEIRDVPEIKRFSKNYSYITII